MARYYYNCASEGKLQLQQMQNACKKSSATNYEYNEFVPIGPQPAGYIVNLSTYVLAARDAHILLAPGQSSDGDVYEICTYWLNAVCFS